MAASRSGPELPSSAPAPAPKLRSCVVCRSRKVRCDKELPCSNCRRSNIACVFPSTIRTPKWTRRLERLTNNAAPSNAPAPQNTNMGVEKVMERLRNLENLVKELSSQLEQANAAANSASDGPSDFNSNRKSALDPDAQHQGETSSVTNSTGMQKQFGRLVLRDTSRSRYVSSGFWSRINDELDGLLMDAPGLASDESDTSEDETSPGKSQSTHELEQTPSERHAFLFRHNLSPATQDFRAFHPLPSQIPFLLDVFSENVNFIVQVVHIPTARKMVRDLRGSDMKRLTTANEALMFSIYYAAIISMEEDDVVTNFGSSKYELSLKYRLGLEHALAKADFLNNPDIVLVQAFTIFLCLVRRHDSPTFVWMMTGLVIRMAQYLGLQRDGTHFEHLTPFEIEMRRRVWWVVWMLDLRASEDQGTDLTITSGSFDTKLPLNINDADINTETEETPMERDGLTDMSFARWSIGLGDVMRQMMAPGVRDGAAGLEDQSRFLNEIYQKYERDYFKQATESGNIAYWVGVTIARLVMAKMTLLVFLPVLFSAPGEHLSDEIRTKLLVSAIEVAEYNHALNAEQACRQWRWIYQTYTHWYSIVYLMIEISRRPWSPIIERAWVALHSSWLIPAHTPRDKKLRIWFPLRKLMATARKHRNAELDRLRADPQAAARLEMEDRKLPRPSSSGPLSNASSDNIFRERWRQLVAIPERSGDSTQISESFGAGLADTSMLATERSISAQDPSSLSLNMASEPTYYSTSGQQAVVQTLEGTNISDPVPDITTYASSELASEQHLGQSYNSFPAVTAGWSDGRTIGPGIVPWLWDDTHSSVDALPNLDLNSIDVSMDLDGEVNWYDWVKSAESREWDAMPSGNEWI